MPVTSVKIYSESEHFSLPELCSSVSTPNTGAAVTFLGTVRKQNRGKKVIHLYYECYPEMLREKATQLIETAREKFGYRQPLNVVAAFRTGKVKTGEASTAIAVASPHRDASFKTCRFLIDEFKNKLTIWKKEHYEDGEKWIENKSRWKDDE